ncbi:MAG: glycosyltransferase family 8 protein [Aristaeellaceae bacterium]
MDKMDVCYATSDEFAIHTGISLLSLLDNNQGVVGRVFVLDYGMTDESKGKLQTICVQYGVQCQFVWAKDKLIEIGEQTGIRNFRDSFATYSRAFLDLLLPDDVDHVLYIDSDTVVIGSVAPIRDMEMTGKVICGCVNSAFYGHRKDKKDRARELDRLLSNNQIYLQCGVLWYSLKNWRMLGCTKEIMDATHLLDQYPYADQTLINNALSDRLFQCMPLKYNLTKHTYCDRYNVVVYAGGGFFSEKEILEALHSPVIIHYCGDPIQRPWYDICQSRRKQHYLAYKAKSPWKDVPLQKVQKAMGFRDRMKNMLVVWSMKTDCYALTRILSIVRRKVLR